ncbi:MAG: hypothetical protein J0J01_14385 [Reyranella sp.]|uniref:hypothetical protein n=1 Tax=Reyranella sp. TaxID=1929291 RepID=UPI001AC8BA8E|nr:hypothetical protein [Reyranella sp.]MBN9088094.1 hypothetical protein [Reyranella sp.]
MHLEEHNIHNKIDRSPEEIDILHGARSQILRAAIEQRIASAKGPQALTFYDRVKQTLSRSRTTRPKRHCRNSDDQPAGPLTRTKPARVMHSS